MKIRNYNSSPYSRYNEVVNKQPFVVSHDLLKKIKPKTDDDKVDDYNNYSLSISKANNLLLQRQLVMFLNELELELRRQKRLTEVDVVFDPVELMCQVFDQNLFAHVHWVRNNFFFKELKLRLEDQVILLQDSWSEILILDQMHHRIHHNLPDETELPNGQKFELLSLALLGVPSMAQKFLGISDNLKQLCFDSADYVNFNFEYFIAVYGTPQKV